MEPFEWLLLGAGLAIGSLIGANSKGVMRNAARGYLIAGEKAREWSGNMREDFQDALEEARYDRDEADYENSLEAKPQHRAASTPRKPAAKSTRSRSSQRKTTTGRTSRASGNSSGEGRGAEAKAETA
jgi:hypothetical protein